VNEILGTNYDLAELSTMAAQLGSDVPYFLTPTICRCKGRGEIVTPVPELAGWSSPIVLLKPAFGVSTPTAYKGLTCSRRLKGVNYSPQKVDNITLVNDLERPVFAKFPILARMKHWLLDQPGTRAALMSGSGSTMFALTETPEQAQEIAARAKAELDPTLFTHCGTVNPQAQAE
jgi:4-diphosphocytidyl-2-C-methyl-D-erythritol kinase